MKYVDFNQLCKKTNAPIFLDKKIAKFLFKQREKVNFIVPFDTSSSICSSGSKLSLFKKDLPQFNFSHCLVLSGKDQWHIIESTQKGKGGFGAVNESKFKIVMTHEPRSKRYQAQVIPVKNVVKIQTPTLKLPYSELLLRAGREAQKQHNHGVNVVGVVGAGDKVITILDDCGISLDKILPFSPSHKYSFQFRLEVAARIACEMLLLQQKGVVHRDLKPANICYKEISKGQFLIIFIDFGLAEDIDSKNNLNCSGTLAYMAPEVLFGQGSSYQSDMYAFAAILGEIFGARNILKYKESATNLPDLANANYCLDGLFSDYDVSEIDPYLLEDIKILLQRLQRRKPEERPTIDHVNKFFITLPARMDAYKSFNERWAAMITHFKEFEEYHQQMKLLAAKHNLSPFRKNLFVDNQLQSHLFNQEMLKKRAEIYRAISTFTLPKSHYVLAKKLIKENRRADFEDQDNPYPDLEHVIRMLHNENMKFKEGIDSFKGCVQEIIKDKQLTAKFITTNSTGMKRIAHILSSTASPIEQLEQLKQIGQSKIAPGLFYFFSHSKVLGKGRHENIEKLYQKLAQINPEQNQTEYCAKTQLDELSEFIRSTPNFTH
ncbi:protein kinase [Fluoribacter dumoffii]|uniref:protein kinase domain-containing protein n=1 Tax=Fluoribacter dumoffii TaxID=463 RepID=UPI002243AE1E|nr:protein kinase [Fluoribacter dumoffii]MCW8417504.1 protein kinase [Fluoribacter dumoffii]MCW8454654.1 protein kinase [Fluoribacter dumoffii]MCW8461268.1 protein kinase [Fluoribacter dumoffii]MCW8484709.1 protein kinase [Fluoribacter dumoffii]